MHALLFGLMWLCICRIPNKKCCQLVAPNVNYRVNADIPLSETRRGKENAFESLGETVREHGLNITCNIYVKGNISTDKKTASHCWSWACSWFCPVSVGVQTAGRGQLDYDGAPCWNLGAGWSCGSPALFLHLKMTSRTVSFTNRERKVLFGEPIWPHLRTEKNDKGKLQR